ncbi:MAG: glycosyltransferase family 4 protein [Planctomycetota bacterium]|jgi:glycosyltransferase involved in cell wall biosynthesis
MHVAMVTVFPVQANYIDGGVAGVSKYLVDELFKHPNVKLAVVVPKSTLGETTCEQWEKFNIYRVGKKGLWSFLPGTVYDIFAGKRQMKSLLRRINPDIVHFQNATFLAANCEQPHVLTIHGIVERDAIWDRRWGILRWPKWLLLKLTEEYGRRRIPHIILISEYVKKFLPKKSKVRTTWLIDNPIADSYFDVKWAPEPGRLFCCSRVRPLKNIVGMIKAFALVVQWFPSAQLRIAGAVETAYLGACEREIKLNNLHSSVHFLRNLSIEDVQFELSKANCLAIPSFQENAPLSVAEAMAAGVPVVGARVGGIPEMIDDGKTGLLVEPHRIEDIAEAVFRIISDETRARSMSQQARQIAKRRFMASTVCKQTLQVYDEILSERY